MSDLIRREDAVEAVYEEFNYVYCHNCENDESDYCEMCHRKSMNWSASKGVIEDVIKSLPSAEAVEVVRCKDCKWYDKFSPIHTKCRCKLAKWWCNDKDFCSYGERREP